VAGVSATTGKPDLFGGSINVDADRDWEKDRLRLKLRTNIAGKNDKRTRGRLGTRTQTYIEQSSQKLEASWKRILHDRLFVISKAEGGRDVAQDINVRAAAFVGPGYRFWEKDKQKQYLDADIGVGYRHEVYRGEDGDNLADIGAGMDYANVFFDGGLTYRHGLDFLLPVNDPDSFLVRTELSAGVPVVGGWAINVTVGLEYQNGAPSDAEAVTARATGGLEYNF